MPVRHPLFLSRVFLSSSFLKFFSSFRSIFRRPHFPRNAALFLYRVVPSFHSRLSPRATERKPAVLAAAAAAAAAARVAECGCPAERRRPLRFYPTGAASLASQYRDAAPDGPATTRASVRLTILNLLRLIYLN